MDQKQIQRALAELWERHLPEIAERVSLLERTCKSLRGGVLSEKERESALQAAHKLAGVLGTFGRARGTELARSVESWLATRATALRNLDQMDSFVSELAEIVHSDSPGEAR
jgi:HPt (histidine-containing phosphotransfer) domain-containing protein